MRKVDIFLGLGILLCMLKVCTQECTGNTKFGEDNVNGNNVLPNSNTYYLICEGDYTFSCCGVIDEWEYTADATGGVELQVWRPTGVGSNYRLISEYTDTAGSTGDKTVSPIGRYLVQAGDCVGWYSSGGDVVGYRDGGNRVTAKYLPAASVNTAGDVDWAGATSSPSYEWAIGGQISTPASPTFSGPSTGSIGEQAGVGDPVVTVTFSDIDTSDELTLTMSNTYFALTDNGDGTGDITVNSASLSTAAGTTETLTITATDLCDLTVIGTVDIDIVHDPAVLANYPDTVDVSEDVGTETTVDTYDCSDTSGSVTTSVSESPANSPPFFFVKATGIADEYAIMARSQMDSSQGQFSYNTQRTYDLTLECCDNVDCVTVVTTVNLIQNTPPYINNIPANASVDVAESAAVGTVIFTVDFTDDDGDTVNVWGICDPSQQITVCPFRFLDSGEVIVDVEIDPSISGIDLFIGVADARNNGTSKTLSVVITDRNNQPAFSNLNNSVIVADGRASNQFVFPISATDADGDSLLFQWSDTLGGTAYFNLNSSTGEVSTSQAIDYDTISTLATVFPFEVTVTDGEDTATATLTVTVADTNEPFTFSSSAYRADILEWTTVGTALTDVIFLIIDGDTTDSYTCTMDCGVYSGYFSMSTSCNITVAALYKLDAGLPTEITCTVEAEDTGTNINSTTVTIAIGYDNNYTPTFESTNYDFSVSSLAVANTAIGTVNATDEDLVSFGTFSYSLNQTNGNYFKIDSSTGEIQTRVSMSSCNCAGTTFIMDVLATDTGALVGTSTVQITVIAPTTNTDDRYKTFFDDQRNVAWFSLLMILAAITAVVTAFVCFKYICMQPCRSPFGRRYNHKPDWGQRNPGKPAPTRRHVTQKPTGIHSVREPPPAGGHSWMVRNRLY